MAIPKRELSAYRQQLALCALRRLGKGAHTTGEVAEMMGTLALADGHPPAAWRWISPAAVAAHLRDLRNRGLALAGDPPRGGAYRAETTWQPAEPDPRAPLPAPPDDGETPGAGPDPLLSMGQGSSKPAAPSTSPYTELTQPQLVVLLEVNDRLLGTFARFVNDLVAETARARRDLAAAGIQLGDRQ
ncbi:hypothetical protein [uncultured Arenimonas sp.]|uniref:hypothetical protein n=1 Tax=uncultured Arenimonas sp. TaxID=546226 RepID=UPI0030DC47F5